VEKVRQDPTIYRKYGRFILLNGSPINQIKTQVKTIIHAVLFSEMILKNDGSIKEKCTFKQKEET
jgi:hypothetical protein